MTVAKDCQYQSYLFDIAEVPESQKDNIKL